MKKAKQVTAEQRRDRDCRKKLSGVLEHHKTAAEHGLHYVIAIADHVIAAAPPPRRYGPSRMSWERDPLEVLALLARQAATDSLEATTLHDARHGGMVAVEQYYQMRLAQRQDDSGDGLSPSN